MIFNPFRRPRRDAASIASLYGVIVAQGRATRFYQAYGVPDTTNGRFEMIALHTIIVLARLSSGSAPLRRLGQAVFDTFCSDMDGNLREMGVGDLAVPRRMRQIGEAFYGRQSAYEEGLASPNRSLLAAAIARNVFGVREPTANAERLAAYMRESVRHLATQNEAKLIRGEIAFPPPDAVDPAVSVEQGS